MVDQVQPATDPTGAIAHCKQCGVLCLHIEGTTMTKGKVPNWRHNWGPLALQDRPRCTWSNGPLYDDQVDIEGPIEEEFIGRWTEDD